MMGLILVVSAFSIDVAQWEVAHHKAQVAADSTALAAASCLAQRKCVQTSDPGDAVSQGDLIATHDGYSDLSKVSYSITSSTVAVTVRSTSSSAFGGLFGFALEPISGTAVASYSNLVSNTSACAASGAPHCISMFAGNPACPPSPSDPDTVGLAFNSTGGGGGDIADAYGNGLVWNDANSSGTWNLTGVSCQSDKPPSTDKNTSLQITTSTVPYPEAWDQPTCDPAHTRASWDAASVAAAGGPGTYCVTTGPSGGCADDTDQAGEIYLDMASLPSGQYEFVGPCVDISGENANVTNIHGQPFVYGTSNIVTKATSTALPTCTAAANNGTSGSSTFFDGNNVSLDAPVYDQCGTVEIMKNKVAFAGYIEAWNIISDKNSGVVTGDGPTSPDGGGVATGPGTDTLIG